MISNIYWKLYAGIIFSIPLFIFIIRVGGAELFLIIFYSALLWGWIKKWVKPLDKDVEKLLKNNELKRGAK